MMLIHENNVLELQMATFKFKVCDPCGWVFYLKLATNKLCSNEEGQNRISTLIYAVPAQCVNS